MLNLPVDAQILKFGDRCGAVRNLQVELIKLGYKDASGHPIVVDGDFGLRTKEAVRAFQRMHGLAVDGVVGDDTHLELAKSQRTPLLSERTHPDNSMFQLARSNLKEIRGVGFRTEAELDRVTAAVVSGAKQAGLTHIDHVMMNTRGDGLIAVQGNLQDPARHVVSIDKVSAITQSIEQSTTRLAQQEMAHQQSVQTQVRAEHMEHRSGLVLGMRQ
jgi:peptidoglycan hydrolase-like protein with peptidoglycan-binding domain